MQFLKDGVQTVGLYIIAYILGMPFYSDLISIFNGKWSELAPSVNKLLNIISKCMSVEKSSIIKPGSTYGYI